MEHLIAIENGKTLFEESKSLSEISFEVYQVAKGEAFFGNSTTWGYGTRRLFRVIPRAYVTHRGAPAASDKITKDNSAGYFQCVRCPGEPEASGYGIGHIQIQCTTSDDTNLTIASTGRDFKWTGLAWSASGPSWSSSTRTGERDRINCPSKGEPPFYNKGAIGTSSFYGASVPT